MMLILVFLALISFAQTPNNGLSPIQTNIIDYVDFGFMSGQGATFQPFSSFPKDAYSPDEASQEIDFYLMHQRDSSTVGENFLRRIYGADLMSRFFNSPPMDSKGKPVLTDQIKGIHDQRKREVEAEKEIVTGSEEKLKEDDKELAKQMTAIGDDLKKATSLNDLRVALDKAEDICQVHIKIHQLVKPDGVEAIAQLCGFSTNSAPIRRCHEPFSGYPGSEELTQAAQDAARPFHSALDSIMKTKSGQRERNSYFSDVMDNLEDIGNSKKVWGELKVLGYMQPYMPWEISEPLMKYAEMKREMSPDVLINIQGVQWKIYDDLVGLKTIKPPNYYLPTFLIGYFNLLNKCAHDHLGPKATWPPDGLQKTIIKDYETSQLIPNCCDFTEIQKTKNAATGILQKTYVDLLKKNRSKAVDLEIPDVYIQLFKDVGKPMSPDEERSFLLEAAQHKALQFSDSANFFKATGSPTLDPTDPLFPEKMRALGEFMLNKGFSEIKVQGASPWGTSAKGPNVAQEAYTYMAKAVGEGVEHPDHPWLSDVLTYKMDWNMPTSSLTISFEDPGPKKEKDRLEFEVTRETNGPPQISLKHYFIGDDEKPLPSLPQIKSPPTPLG